MESHHFLLPVFSTSFLLMLDITPHRQC